MGFPLEVRLFTLVFTIPWLILGCGQASITGLSKTPPPTPIIESELPPARLSLQGPSRVRISSCGGPYLAFVLDSQNRPATSRGTTTVTLDGENQLSFYADADCTQSITSTTLSHGGGWARFFVKGNSQASVNAGIHAAGLSSSNAPLEIIEEQSLTILGLPFIDHVYLPPNGSTQKKYLVQVLNSGLSAVTIVSGRIPTAGSFSFTGGSFPGTNGTCAANLKLNPGQSCTISFSVNANAMNIISAHAEITATADGRSFQRQIYSRIAISSTLLPSTLSDNSADSAHLCSVMNDGSVICLGSNSVGELGLGHLVHKGSGIGPMSATALEPVARIKDSVAVSSGLSFSCAQSATGTVKCWGQNNYGQLGVGDTTPRGDDITDLTSDWANVSLGAGLTAKKITSGVTHSCALLNDKTVKCWGRNNVGQLGIGSTTSQGHNGTTLGANMLRPVHGLGDIADIATGGDSTCAISEAGRAKCWGLNSQGQLGVGDTINRGTTLDSMGSALPDLDLGSGYKILSIRMGRTHSCGVLERQFDGRRRLKCWGQNNYGQLGLGHTTNIGVSAGQMGSFLPEVALGDDFDVFDVALTNTSTCALALDGRAKCWGRNNVGQLGMMNTTDLGTQPGQLVGLSAENKLLKFGAMPEKIVPLADGFCAILSSRMIKCWGSSATFYDGACSPGANMNCGSPELAFFQRDSLVSEVSVGQSVTAVANIVKQSTIFGGKSRFSYLAMPDGIPLAASDYSSIDVGENTVDETSIGYGFLCSRLSNGDVYCSGENEDGVLGRGKTSAELFLSADFDEQVLLGTGVTAKTVVTGSEHVCVITNSNRVKCWGDARKGALGHGSASLTDHLGIHPSQMGDNLPYIDLGAVSTVKDLSLGFRYNCVILSNDETKCWGDSAFGKLGISTLGAEEDKGDQPGEMGDALPALAFGAGSPKATKVRLGSNHACAILNNNTLKCWGSNTVGQVGSGGTADVYDPAATPPVDLGPGFVPMDIALGVAHTCVLSTTNQIKCFGQGSSLGANATTDRGRSPADMGANLVAISFSGPFSKAISLHSSSQSATTCAKVMNAYDNADTRTMVKCWGENSKGQAGYLNSVGSVAIGDAAAEMRALAPVGANLTTSYRKNSMEYMYPATVPFVTPNGVTQLHVAVWGGGGGGASVAAAGSGTSFGGGSGGFASGVIASTPGTSTPVTVGLGGAGGLVASTIAGFFADNTPLSGSPGQASSFAGISATGGFGGVTTGSFGAGGSGTSGTFTFNGYSSSLTVGAAAPWGGTSRSQMTLAGIPGLTGYSPGGGGGGYSTPASANMFPGGSGATGRVLIETRQPLDVLRSVASTDFDTREIRYQTPGLYHFVVPQGSTKVRVQMWGAGGGGGASADASFSGCGGGSGAWIDTTLEVKAGDVLALQVGSGGLGGRASSVSESGGNGQNSALQSETLSLSAGGGTGGAGAFKIAGLDVCNGAGASFSRGGVLSSVPENSSSQAGLHGRSTNSSGETMGGSGANAPHGGRGGDGGSCFAADGAAPGGAGGGTDANCAQSGQAGRGADGRIILIPL